MKFLHSTGFGKALTLIVCASAFLLSAQRSSAQVTIQGTAYWNNAQTCNDCCEGSCTDGDRGDYCDDIEWTSNGPGTQSYCGSTTVTVEGDVWDADGIGCGFPFDCNAIESRSVTVSPSATNPAAQIYTVGTAGSACWRDLYFDVWTTGSYPANATAGGQSNTSICSSLNMASNYDGADWVNNHTMTCNGNAWYRYYLTAGGRRYLRFTGVKENGTVTAWTNVTEVRYSATGNCGSTCNLGNGGGGGDFEVISPQPGYYYVRIEDQGVGTINLFDIDTDLGPSKIAYDDICSAYQISTNVVLGYNSGLIAGNNVGSTDEDFCGVDEPQENENRTVWYKFQTGSNIGSQLSVYVENAGGDNMTPDIAVFKGPSTISCASQYNFGTLTYVGDNDGTYLTDDDAEVILSTCNNTYSPSTWYYVQIDDEGNTAGVGYNDGNFRIRVRDLNIIEAGDNCSAPTSLGTLTQGGTIGNSGARYSNLCATPTGEGAYPAGCAFNIQHGVWFTFTTAANVTGYVDVRGFNTGNDDIDLQLTIFEGSSCGALTELDCEYDPTILFCADPLCSEDMLNVCVKPSTTYYILVDGGGLTAALEQGVFGLTVTDDVEPVNDAPCTATSIATQAFNTYNTTFLNNQTNVNGTNCNEPNPGWFSNGNDHVVWYKVNLPGRGLVIDANNLSGDNIDIQLALYEANTTCSNLTYQDREWDPGWPVACVGGLCDEDFVVTTCIDPDKEYYLAVDGGDDPIGLTALTEGTFSLRAYFNREGGLNTCVYNASTNKYGAPRIGSGAIPTGGSATLLNNSNFCGLNDAEMTAAGYPIPSWSCDQAVWYVFRPPASGSVRIDATSDPVIGPALGFLSGDAIDLQLAVYESSNTSCSPPSWSIVSSESSSIISGGFDEYLIANCLDPNKDYYLLVDGSGLNTKGFFDLQISDYGITTPNDLVCNAIDIVAAQSPALQSQWASCNGNVTLTLNNQNNYCGDNINEPVPSGWSGQTSRMVWYKFTAPPSGGVWVEVNTVTSNPLAPEYLNAKIAIYDVSAATLASCGAPAGAGFTHIASDYDLDIPPASTGEDLYDNILGINDKYVQCLEPGKTYYIAVDGQSVALGPEWDQGEFSISIESSPRDAPGPNDAICAAEALGDPTGGSVSTTSLRPRSAPYACMSAENNFCMDNAGDGALTLNGFNFWDFDQTAWYTFVAPSTGSVRVDALNVNCGNGSDNIDLQFAIFQSADNTCTGELSVIDADYFPSLLGCLDGLCDETKDVHCLETGKTYFIVVDGGGLPGTDLVQGCFELEITEIPAVLNPPYNDDVCDARPTTPFVAPWSDNDETNRCASIEFGIPDPPAFGRDHTVWYTFTTPGGPGPYAVRVDVTRDFFDWPILDAQIALYESSNNTCSGTLTVVDSDYDPISIPPFEESFDFHCLQPSTNYWLMVDGSAVFSQGDFNISIESISPNPIAVNNDICSVVSTLTGDFGTLGAAGGSTLGGLGGGDPLWNNFCSDVEPGEPDPAAFDLDQTVWFKFRTPVIVGANDGVNVTIELDTDLSYGDLIDLQVAVYQPDASGCGANLYEIESAYDPVLNLFDEDLTLCLKEDSDYWIQVDGSALNTQGYFKIRITNNGNTLRPPNDDFCNAQPLTVGLWRNGDDNNCATLELGEPGAGFDQQRTVWYSFVAPSSGRVEIRTVDADGALSGIDPELHLYEFSGSCSAGAFTGSFTELGSAYFPTIGITNPDDVLEYECLFPGDTYYIQVDGTTVGGPEGVFNIRVSDLGHTAPVNDACAGAITLPVNTESCQYSSGTWSTQNYGEATRSLYDVSGCGQNCGDTWYKFTMPATGFAKIEGNDELGLAGVTNSALAVIAYEGTCGALTYMDCDIGGFSGDVDFSIAGTPGATYYLQVFSDNQNSDDNDNFQICVSERCSADDCPDAVIAGDMVFGQEYCWDVRDATGENSSEAYSVCGTGVSPNKSVYFTFETDDFCWGYNITIKTPDLSENGNCTLGNAPSSELKMGVFKDNGGTLCDNTYDELLDCETFNDCTYPAGVNKTITYYVGSSGDSIRKNSQYVIQLQAEDFLLISSDDVVDGTIEVSKICDGRTWAYAPLGTTASNGFCEEANGWRHYYNDNGTPLDVADDILIFSVFLNGNVFDGVATINVLNNYTAKLDPGLAGTWTMRRYWDFDLTSGSIDPNFPVGVRFYYQDSEKQEIITAAQAFAAAATPALQYEPFEWFKTLNGVDFSPSLVHPRYIEQRGWSETGQFTPNVFTDTQDGPGQSAQDHDEDIRNVFCNGIQYVEMQGLTGFSGGTGATGASDAAQSPLPVELITFVGWNEGDVNKLEWVTASEVNNDVFVVERSIDAVDFMEIGTVPGNGTTNEEHTYNFTDDTPVDGWNYYRLKQIDFDGTVEYSSIISVDVRGTDLRTAIVKVHPNPAYEEVYVQLQSAYATDFKMIVMDITGRIVHRKDVAANAGLNVPFAIDVSEYGSGVYIVSMEDQRTGERFETKFVKR